MDKCMPEAPFAFGYEYPDGVRFDTRGSSINGSQPVATILLYSKQQVEQALREARLEEAKRWNAFHYSGELDGDLHWNQHRMAALESGNADCTDGQGGD